MAIILAISIPYIAVFVSGRELYNCGEFRAPALIILPVAFCIAAIFTALIVFDIREWIEKRRNV